MDAILEKRGSNARSEWTPRCCRLRHCELVQYKKEVTDFKKCSDGFIKHRYCVLDVAAISMTAQAPHAMQLTFRHDDRTTTALHLRFPRGDHLLFCAWFRVLASCSNPRPDGHRQAMLRPLASTHCFALFYILRMLYEHEALLSSPFLFQMSLRNTSSPKHIERLFCALTVTPREMAVHLNGARNYRDVHVLTMALLHALRNLPSSLLADAHCRKWTDFICGAVDRLQDEGGQDLAGKLLPDGMDHDLYALWSDPRRKAHLAEMKTWILSQFQGSKSGNGVDQRNRYGLTLQTVLV